MGKATRNRWLCWKLNLNQDRAPYLEQSHGVLIGRAWITIGMAKDLNLCSSGMLDQEVAVIDSKERTSIDKGSREEHERADRELQY